MVIVSWLQYHPEDNDNFYTTYNLVLVELNIAFTTLFSIEAVLKLTAFGPWVS